LAATTRSASCPITGATARCTRSRSRCGATPARSFGPTTAAAIAIRQDNPLDAKVRFAAAESTAPKLEIELPLDRLLTRPSEAGDEGLVRLVVLAEDAEGRVTAREKLHPFRRGEDEAIEERQLLVVAMELAAGGHTVGVGIRDELAGETSYLRAEIEVVAERRSG
jgi:hypothetical protein